MSYTYEQLGDERFQKLCHAVLAIEHPDVQCLPTGQPDGGRDAFIANQDDGLSSPSIVFQVKYSVNPLARSEREAVQSLIETEKDKIARLIQRGLRRYVLMTNVSGTAHLDSGSIDKVNADLSAAFGIPTFCYWRDDLDARIDSNSDIKWSYPEILRATDVLQDLYQGTFSDQERRLRALKAYLSYQYRYDSKLKFKQVNLEKGLIDLFVDVPAEAYTGGAISIHSHLRQSSFTSEAMTLLLARRRRGRLPGDGEGTIGAIKSLIDDSVRHAFPRMVLEGAPGQGKSTVTQYLCQTYRIQLLKKAADLSRIPAELRPLNTCLPFKVDLRDYATWLSGGNPFSDNFDQSSPFSQVPALEAFIAAQVAFQSGGTSFDTDDLLSVARHSRILIVLDGFDEVADVVTRSRIVQEVSDAAARFDGNTIQHNIIVTSRPAAFANSPGFTKDEWQHLHLLPLSKEAISGYTEKWMDGHAMEARERQSLVRLLNEKLELPHVRDLARNPMQLAILLNLISSQGASLPDKRTTLYDRYVEIFLNRESEKNRVIRDKRELVIEIHQYLAWVIQSEVELNNKSGNIAEDRLRSLVRDYLVNTGRDTAIADILFVNMVERVVALVSRVQGTLEFEVQPLREYFAARYLYETVPYIQAGSEKRGSIADRFDALARNSFWLNVTRFYAGCYSFGEVPSLVDGLSALMDSEQFRNSGHIEKLALILLADFVFNQQPRSVSRILARITSSPSFRIALSSYEGRDDDATMALPAENGRAEMLAAALMSLADRQQADSLYAIFRIIAANGSPADLTSGWEKASVLLSKGQYIYTAAITSMLRSLPISEVLPQVTKDDHRSMRLLYYNDRQDVLDAIPGGWLSLIEHQFTGSSPAGLRDHLGTVTHTADAATHVISITVEALLLTGQIEERAGVRLLDRVMRFNTGLPHDEAPEMLDRALEYVDDAWVARMVSASRALLLTSSSDTVSHIKSVRDFILCSIDRLGVSAQLLRFGLRLSDELRLAEHMGSSNTEAARILSLMVATRENTVNFYWLRDRLNDSNESSHSKLIILFYVFSISPPSTIIDLWKFLESAISDLPEEMFKNLLSALDTDSGYLSSNDARTDLVEVIDSISENISARLAILLSLVGDDVLRAKLFDCYFIKNDRREIEFQQAKVTCAYRFGFMSPERWTAALGAIAAGYHQGVVPSPMRHGRNDERFSEEALQWIIENHSAVPLSILATASERLAGRSASGVIEVSKIATRDGWFADA